MKGKRIVHMIGTGTIGEPLLRLLAIFSQKLGIDEVTFHKRTPLLTDWSKVLSLERKVQGWPWIRKSGKTLQ